MIFMKFKYNFEREDFNKFLKAYHNRYNLICIGIFTIFFFIFCADLLKTDAGAVLISFVVSALLLYSIMHIVDAIFIKVLINKNDKNYKNTYGEYDIEITDSKIVEKVNDNVFEVTYDNIYKITKSDKWLIIYPRDGKMMYFFIRKLITEKGLYDKIVNKVMTNYNKAKGKKVLVERAPEDIMQVTIPKKEEVKEEKPVVKKVSTNNKKVAPKKTTTKKTSTTKKTNSTKSVKKTTKTTK